jgi:hypothetical protein
MTSPVNTGSSVSWKPNTYPPAARGDHVDVYKSEKDGDVRIPDPYRWLEVDSPQTDEWTTAQEQYTNAYLEQLPHRQQLTDEIRYVLVHFVPLIGYGIRLNNVFSPFLGQIPTSRR